MDFVIANTEAEEALLGSILIDPQALHVATKYVEADDFYTVKHQWLFEALQSVETPDIVTVCDYLSEQKRLVEAGGEAWVMDMLNAVPTSTNAEEYAKLIARDSLRRKVVLGASRLAQLAYEETDPEKLLSNAATIVRETTKRAQRSDPKPLSEIIPVVAKNALSASQRPRQDLIYTGLSSIDKVFGPMLSGHTYIIAARTGVGKSSLGLGLALYNSIREKKYGLYFSLEMPDEDLGRRALSPEVNKSAIDILLGNIGDLQEFEKGVSRTSTPYLYIDSSSGQTADTIFQKAKRMQELIGLDYVIIDYIQLVSDPSREKRIQVANVSRATKAIAAELNIPVINIAQLNREITKRGAEPLDTDLAEADALAQDASGILALWEESNIKPEGQRYEINWKTLKNRNFGRFGKGKVHFIPHLTQFVDEAPLPTKEERNTYRDALLVQCNAERLTWNDWLFGNSLNRRDEQRARVLRSVQDIAMPALLNNRWVVLWSSGYGAGKSHMARIMQSRLILDHGFPTTMINWRTLTKDIQQSWNTNPGQEEVLREPLKAHCVIVDELDLVRASNGSGQWYIEQLYDLFDASMALERSGTRRPLVLIMHQSPTDFATKLTTFGDIGKSAANRILNRAGMMAIDFSAIPSWITEKPQF